jgi:hypothetical protein
MTRRRSAYPVALLAALAGLVGALTVGLAVAATSHPAPAAPARSTSGSARHGRRPSGPAVVFGLGDQSDPAMFRNALFEKLHVQATRIVADWSVALTSSRERTAVDDWYRAAIAAHVQPLLAFGNVKHHTIPTDLEFLRAFRAARGRWPHVQAWETWNEANDRNQRATYNDPARAARFAHIMQATCPHCVILPLSIVLERGPQYEDRWIEVWERAYGGPPAVWAVHDYADPNFFTTRSLSSFLGRHPTGSVWLTEEGAFAKFSVQFPWNLARQALAAEWVVRDAIAFRRRVRRVYYYEWAALTRSHRKIGWDTALVNVQGQPRPAYAALLHWRPRLR